MCANTPYSYPWELPSNSVGAELLCEEAQEVGGNSPNPHMVSGKTVFISESVQLGDVCGDG